MVTTMYATNKELDDILARIAFLEVAVLGSPRGPAARPRPPVSPASDGGTDPVGKVAALLEVLRGWGDVSGDSLNRLVARLRECGHAGSDELLRQAVRLRLAELGRGGYALDPDYAHLIGR